MSIWGPGPFDNDDGADWVDDLQKEPALTQVRDALLEVCAPEHVGFVDVTDCCHAVAAAEVLAELLGAPGEDPALDDEDEEAAEALGEEIKREDRRNISKLVQQAVDAVEIVLNDTENSELRQLWEKEPADMPAWTATMTALLQRLHKVASP